MDREPASPSEAGPPAPRPRLSRRLIAAGAAVVVLLGAGAVLGTRLPDSSAGAAPGAAVSPSASPSPSPTSLTVAAIYKRVAPSMVIVRTPGGLGRRLIVN